MNDSTLLARVLVDEMIRCGVTDAVLCPGSRSAPLAFALHAAELDGRARLHVRVDERGAGYLAVGLSLRSGRPVVVACTSGTAVANLHPAVLEAAHAGLPLVVVTADRPPEMVGTGASQTIDQHGVFGSAVRAAATVAADPAGSTAGPGRWRATVSRVLATATGATGTDPGPVHLNVPLREPLVPDGLCGPPPAGRDGGAPRTRVRRASSALPALALDPDAPTLVLAGDGAGAAPLPDTAVLVAEPSSGRWDASLRCGAWLLGAATSGARPDLLPHQVVVLGRPTLHRAVQRLLADDRVLVHAVPGHRRTWWNDTGFDVVEVGSLPHGAWGDAEFARRWRDADAAAAVALDAGLDDDPVGGMRLARDVVAALPAGAQLVLGPSSPIRDVALAAAPPQGVGVLSNRGVAGIDGVVSTAVGAALAHDGPSVALLGDVTLLHDANGLLGGAGERRPDLTLVVANDDGGSVFALLEQGAPEHTGTFERVFGTPHGADLASLCRAFRVPHRRLRDTHLLPELLARGEGVRVVEVPVDRGGRRAGHAALRARIDGAITPLTPSAPITPRAAGAPR